MKSRHILILVLALALFGLGTVVAFAADGNKAVGVVVAFPDGTTHAEIVTVPVTATTYDVLQRAKIELVGANGSFGPAVCSINKVGCPASNCFCDAKHFWAFYHLDKGTNQWVASPEGVGVAVPADGSVEGFAWSEMDAKFNPITQPPVMTFQQISAKAGGPAEAVAATPGASGQSGAATPAAPAQAPAPTATAAAASAPNAMPTTGSGPAMVWVGALGLALLLAGAAIGRSARRSALTRPGHEQAL